MVHIAITERAARAIEVLMKRVPDKFADRDMLPCVTWLVEGSNKDFVPGPEIGLNERADVPDDFIVRMHGVELAIGLPEELLERYSNHSLDYIDKRFVFIKTPQPHL